MTESQGYFVIGLLLLILGNQERGLWKMLCGVVALVFLVIASVTFAHADPLEIDGCSTRTFGSELVAPEFRAEWEAAGQRIFGDPEVPTGGYQLTIGICEGRDALCPAFPGVCEPRLVEAPSYRKANILEWFDGTPLWVALGGDEYRPAGASDAFVVKTFWVKTSDYRWEPSFEDCSPGRWWVPCEDPPFWLIRVWVNNVEVTPQRLLGPNELTALWLWLNGGVE